MADSHALALRARPGVSAGATLPSHSPFLELPAEVRLRIYELLFEDGILHVDVPRGCNCATCSVNKNKAGHRILMTCRLCREEARPLLFSSTLWIFPALAWSSLEDFTSSPRSSDGAKLVRCMSLGLTTLEVQRSFDGLPSLKNVIVRANGFATLRSIVRGDADVLSDRNVVSRVRNSVLTRAPFLTLARMLLEPRRFSLSLLVRLEFLQPGKVLPHRWQHTDVVINLDAGLVDRSAKSFYLAQMKG